MDQQASSHQATASSPQATSSSHPATASSHRVPQIARIAGGVRKPVPKEPPREERKWASQVSISGKKPVAYHRTRLSVCPVSEARRKAYEKTIPFLRKSVLGKIVWEKKKHEKARACLESIIDDAQKLSDSLKRLDARHMATLQTFQNQLDALSSAERAGHQTVDVQQLSLSTFVAPRL